MIAADGPGVPAPRFATVGTSIKLSEIHATRTPETTDHAAKSLCLGGNPSHCSVQLVFEARLVKTHRSTRTIRSQPDSCERVKREFMKPWKRIRTSANAGRRRGRSFSCLSPSRRLSLAPRPSRPCIRWPAATASSDTAPADFGEAHSTACTQGPASRLGAGDGILRPGPPVADDGIVLTPVNRQQAGQGVQCRPHVTSDGSLLETRRVP